MYLFVQNNQILDIERRDITLSEYYHADIVPSFIEVPNETEVEIGWQYINGEIIKPILENGGG